jgi:hypothetical protein
MDGVSVSPRIDDGAHAGTIAGMLEQEFLPMGRYCPPCDKCAFPAGSRSVADTRVAQVLVSGADYGCVRKDGGELVQTEDGELGVLRSSGFHPLTEAGADFHRRQEGSPLAAYL